VLHQCFQDLSIYLLGSDTFSSAILEMLFEFIYDIACLHELQTNFAVNQTQSAHWKFLVNMP